MEKKILEVDFVRSVRLELTSLDFANLNSYPIELRAHFFVPHEGFEPTFSSVMRLQFRKLGQ